MRYYRLMVDERVKHRVETAPLSPLQVEDILSGHTLQAEDTPVSSSTYRSRTVYPDFLEFPLPLVSDSMKALLEKYMPELEWKAAILTDFQKARQDVYWVLRPPVVDCLSSQTEWYPDHTLKQLVLKHGKIESSIFRIAGLLEARIYINLAVAESLLRRPFTGVRVQKVEMATKEE